MQLNWKVLALGAAAYYWWKGSKKAEAASLADVHAGVFNPGGGPGSVTTEDIDSIAEATQACTGLPTSTGP